MHSVYRLENLIHQRSFVKRYNYKIAPGNEISTAVQTKLHTLHYTLKAHQ